MARPLIQEPVELTESVELLHSLIQLQSENI